MFRLLYIFLFFSLSSLGQGIEKQWTLQECIDHALKNNLTIRQARLNALNSKQLLSQNIGQALPDINGAASHVYNFGRTIDPFTNTFANDKVLSQNFSLSSNFDLFAGFQNTFSILSARLAYQAALKDIQKAENDIALAVASAYLQILFNMELVDIADRQIELSTQQVERTQKLVNAGTAAQGVLLDIEAQLATEELNLVTAQNQLQISHLDLAQLMNLEDVLSFRVSRPVIEMPASSAAVTMEQAYLSALAGMPEVKSAELKLKSSEKSLQSARGSMSPRLSMFASLGSGYSGANKEIENVTLSGQDTTGVTATGVPVFTPRFSYTYKDKEFKDQLADNYNRSVGLRLTVPLLNGFQTRTAIKRSKIQVESSDISLQQVKLDVRKNVQKAYIDANGALKKFNAANKAVVARKESFKYTQQRFDVGVANSFDYNLSKNNLARAESDLVQAKYEYVFKLKVLDFYQGKPLTF